MLKSYKIQYLKEVFKDIFVYIKLFRLEQSREDIIRDIEVTKQPA